MEKSEDRGDQGVAIRKKGMTISEWGTEREKAREGVATRLARDCSDGTRGGRKRGRGPHGGSGREDCDKTVNKTTTPCDGDSDGVDGIRLKGQTTVESQTHSAGKVVDSHSSGGGGCGGREEGRGLQSPTVSTLTSSPLAPGKGSQEKLHPPDVRTPTTQSRYMYTNTSCPNQ